MRKTALAFALVLVLLMSLTPALADNTSTAQTTVDLSSMSFEDLVALKDQLNLAIWNSSDWKEVTVPQGVWQVGKDIPAGHWTIKPTSGNMANVGWGEKLNEQKTDIETGTLYSYETIIDENFSLYNKSKDRTQIDWELTDGTYVTVSISNVVFTPYDGKPAFTFG